MTSRTEARRSSRSSPRGTSNGTCLSDSVRLARTMRWAIGFGHEEGARDLVGRQAAEQAQGQCDAAFARKYGMAGGEHQTQQVVADVVVEDRKSTRLNSSH